jgi:hypothetical protein
MAAKRPRGERAGGETAAVNRPRRNGCGETSHPRSGVGEQKLVKITGHSNPSSLKPYLQLDQEHHREIIGSIRTTIQETVIPPLKIPACKQTINKNTKVLKIKLFIRIVFLTIVGTFPLN